MSITDQLYRRLLRKIQLAEEGWREGEMIRTENELAGAEGVSRMTLRTALKRLAADGLLAGVTGKRRIVTRPPTIVRHSDRQPVEKELGKLAKSFGAGRSQAFRQLCRYCPSLLSHLQDSPQTSTSWGEALRESGQKPNDITIRPPTATRCYALASDPRFDVEEIREALNVGADAEVYWLQRLRLANDVPVALQWCVVPIRPWGASDLRITKGDLVPGGLTSVYHAFGIRRDFATVSFQARRASADEAGLLKVEVDAPMIEERRISYMLRRVAKSDRLWPYEYLLTLYTHRIRLHSAWSDLEDDLRGDRPAKRQTETKHASAYCPGV